MAGKHDEVIVGFAIARALHEHPVRAESLGVHRRDLTIDLLGRNGNRRFGDGLAHEHQLFLTRHRVSSAAP